MLSVSVDSGHDALCALSQAPRSARIRVTQVIAPPQERKNKKSKAK
jgi:hypothetical protein